jgi:hypothetical protein
MQRRDESSALRHGAIRILEANASTKTNGGNGRAAAIPSAFSGRRNWYARESFKRAAERDPTRRSATSPTILPNQNP